MDLGNRVNIALHDKKFIFMMLKKCASVTMGKVILNSLGYKDLSGGNVNKVLGKLDHPVIYEVSSRDYMDYTKVVWVRNPFDRLASGWFDRIYSIRNEDTMNWYGIPNTISFPDFIDWVCAIDDANINTHFRQQTYYITIGDKLIPNVIMKLETLKNDWDKLKSKHTWLSDIEFYDNKSNKGNYRDYYTKELIKKVSYRFNDDLRLLKYDVLSS